MVTRLQVCLRWTEKRIYCLLSKILYSNGNKRFERNKNTPFRLPSIHFKDLSWGEWHGMTGLDLARSGKLSDLMLISQRLKKSIGSCAQQYGHWSEQNRIIRDENAFSSCLDCIALPSCCSHTAFESSFIHSRWWKEPTYCPGGSLILRLSPHQETTPWVCSPVLP